MHRRAKNGASGFEGGKPFFLAPRLGRFVVLGHVDAVVRVAAETGHERHYRRGKTMDRTYWTKLNHGMAANLSWE